MAPAGRGGRPPGRGRAGRAHDQPGSVRPRELRDRPPVATRRAARLGSRDAKSPGGAGTGRVCRLDPGGDAIVLTVALPEEVRARTPAVPRPAPRVTLRRTPTFVVPDAGEDPMDWNLADLFEAVADAVPDSTAVICGDRRLTFPELDERSTRLANHLIGAGVAAGDHVGLYALQRSRVDRGMFGSCKAAGGADQRQLPLRRGGAALPVRQRGPHRRWSTAGSSSRASPRCEPTCPKLKAFVSVEDGIRRGPRDDRRGRVRGRARGGVARARLPGPGAPRTTCTSSTPAAPPGCPRASCGRQEDFFLSTIGPLLEPAAARSIRPTAVVERRRRTAARSSASRSRRSCTAPRCGSR